MVGDLASGVHTGTISLEVLDRNPRDALVVREGYLAGTSTVACSNNLIHPRTSLVISIKQPGRL